MEINSDTLDEFREDFMQMSRSLEEKYGITIKLGKITYYDNHFDAKLSVTNGTDPEAIAENNFNDKVWKYKEYGLHKGMYRQVFIGTDGKKYYITGFRDNAKKWPFTMVRISDGEKRVCSPRFIKEFLNEKFYENQA